MSKGTLLKSFVKGAGGSGGGSTTGANLLDIKTMAVAVADKGWACLSKEGNFLSQAQAPTLYNSLVEKLESADKDWSSIQTGEEYSFAFDKAVVIFNNKIYTINSSQLYVADSPTDSPELLDNTTTYSKFICVGNNILVCAISNNKYRVFDKEGNHKDIDEVAGLTSLDYVGGGNENGTARRLFIEGNYIYAFFTGTKIYKIVDDYDNISITEITLDTTVNDMYQDTTNGKIYKFQDNTSNKGELYVADSVEGEYTLIKTFSFGIGGTNACVVAEGNFILVLVRSGIDRGIWTTDNWTTTNTTSGYIFTDSRDYFKPFVKNGYVYNFQYSSSVTYKRSITDLDNATSLPYAFITYNDNLMLFIYDDIRIDYSEIENKVYTDTFVINGNAVTINYAKAQDGTKIITDLTQSSAIASVNSYLGYNNYFQLNTTVGSEGVTLPYNSNLWTYMYVGDNYVETNIPTGNATRLLAQAENINVTGATPTITISANKTYSFDTAITSLTISDVEVSDLETMLYFTTGAGTIQFTAPNTLRWGGGNEQPSLEPNTVYCIAIRNGLAEIDNFGTTA